MEFLKDFFVLLGRLCISGTFLWSAYEKFKNYDMTKSYMKLRGVPQVEFVAPISLGLKVLGALIVLFGWYAHVGALFLLLVAVPSVLKLHAFWHVPAGEKAMEKALFIKEVAVIGGVLLLLGLGAGHFGLN